GLRRSWGPLTTGRRNPEILQNVLNLNATGSPSWWQPDDPLREGTTKFACVCLRVARRQRSFRRVQAVIFGIHGHSVPEMHRSAVCYVSGECIAARFTVLLVIVLIAFVDV